MTKNIISKILEATLIILVFVLLTGCNSSDYHIGSWSIVFGEDENECVFSPNGSVTFTWNNGFVNKGTYKVVSSTEKYTELLVYGEDSNLPAVFRAYDNIMVNYTDIFKFKKYSSSENSLYGSWIFDGSPEVLNIFENGTLTFGDSDPYIFVQNGTIYQVYKQNGEKCLFIFDYDGVALTLMKGNVYERNENN